ncbi:tetratricopeptide repeat protein [Halomonas heilongjiangensis]|uniref:Tetratricopeptide repeat protein 38 n=1 Tax=Halomonas heilongjiangensis TaxID=1387883 RepID=A0A2N7TVD5_9GAMM|nr:tetratricopeptide repeat protein [Halomonas heilongjiangensis]PMR72162.1 tetratricopeptide repeat-containing protein [Halomonas heilongjiangensis]PXX91413.1 tetratricopeptide repeat protein 38 family protein [Halomonas heilongjiangensis]
MLTDRQGNPLPGATAETADLYAHAVDAFNLYRGDPVAPLDQALEIAPDFTMARLFRAYLFALATEPDAADAARADVAIAKASRLNDREASHVAVLDQLLAGEWTAAACALDRHNLRHPHDLLALQAGHLADFYRANGRDLRDRLARVLPKWSPDMPGHSVLLGMYAFGLEESGAYARAEETGRQALDGEPLDCWAHHAVAHVMEMQGRAEDGLGWMIAREPYWAADDNLFKVHNWWHRALCHLELGQTGEALALYDGPIRQERSAVALDMVDASALLWRLHLTGQNVGPRWRELADTWDRHADGKLYPFNDWHAVMAYLGAGRDDRVERLLAALRNAGGGAETAAWARRIGLPLTEGFVAFWRGDYATAVERLHPARFIANAFGGSHAQRDIIDWTLTEAALRGGYRDVAEGLAHERLAAKPHSPLNRSFLSRANASAVGEKQVA